VRQQSSPRKGPSKPKGVPKLKIIPNWSVVVFVPALNEADCIGDTIASLHTQTYPISKIVVIDDGSKDNTGGIAKRAGATVIRFERDDENNKPRSFNTALRQTDSDLFVTVDGDTFLAPDAIEKCVAKFDDPRVACASGTVIPRHIRSIWERARFFEYCYAFMVPKWAQAYLELIFVAPGCFSVHRREHCQAIGDFSNRTQGEDLDQTLRYLEAGYRVVHVPDAICEPIEPPTFKIFVRQLSRWSRVFLQNMKIRRRGLTIGTLGPQFNILAWTYILSGLVGPAAIGLVIYGLFRYPGYATYVIPGALLIQAIFTWLPALIKAAQLKKFWLAVSCLPAFMVGQYVGSVVYLYAFVMEVVFGISINVWHKGH
jgi:cellulose synthase/poly-beta-1,6-N-acetylglucosamine synthase-like glycosyltransferase